MFADIQGDIICHCSNFVFPGDRGKIKRIPVGMKHIIPQERPAGGNGTVASPLIIVVISRRIAGGKFRELLSSVFRHTGNTFRIVIPCHSLLTHNRLPQEIGVAHIIEQPERLFLMRTVCRNEPHIPGTVSQQLIHIGILIRSGSRDSCIPRKSVRIRFDFFVIKRTISVDQTEVLSACTFDFELFRSLRKDFHVEGAVFFSGSVEPVVPFDPCPEHGVFRIGVAVQDLIREDIILIFVCRPVIEADLGTESGGIPLKIRGTVQIGRIAFLREGMPGMHLHEDVQIIVFGIDRRIPQLLIIIPADNIPAVIRIVAVSDSVVSDFLREEIKAVPVTQELFEHIICKPCLPCQEIRHIFLQIGICIQCHTVLQNCRKIVVGSNDIRKIAAG